MQIVCKHLTFTLLLLFIFGISCKSNDENSKMSYCYSDNVFGFYYNWYGNTEYDGKEIHWAHHVIPQNNNQNAIEIIPGKTNLSSNFYPQLRNYSSNDPVIIAKHMKMFARARIGIVAVTWWGNHDIGSPIFEEVSINIGNGKKFIIEAKNVSSQNKYIQSANLNGKLYDKTWIEHSDIAKGGKLTFIMGPRSKKWGSSRASRAPSMSKPLN